jgi:tripartite-type tricarboxylate transporter receptor subunit TctC
MTPTPMPGRREKETRAMQQSRRTFLMAAGAGAAASVFPTLGRAQATFPDRPVRFLVGYSPGGLPDTVARVVAQKLSERWGQQVLVENRAGANGGIAADAVAKAAPDGYTLLVTDNSTTAINPHLYAKLPYDVKALAPITMLARAPLYLAAHPSFPGTTLQELVQVLKANPGKYSYGSSGVGSTHHLCMESMKAALGLDITHVPYKGTGQSVPALLSGQVAMVWSAFPSLAPHAKDARTRLIAVNSAQRSTGAPTLPAVAEMVPGFDFAPTIGVFGPQGLPRDLVARIVASAREAVRADDVVARLGGLDIQAVGSTAEEYATSLRADDERYARAVRISGAKAD